MKLPLVICLMKYKYGMNATSIEALYVSIDQFQTKDLNQCPVL